MSGLLSRFPGLYQSSLQAHNSGLFVFLGFPNYDPKDEI